MFNNSRSISVTQKIDSSALELWKIISKPGNLNLTHQFCKINDIIKTIGNKTPIVRAMPNTAISIRESMTSITTTSKWKSILTLQKIYLP